jgi:hypothetical protein
LSISDSELTELIKAKEFNMLMTYSLVISMFIVKL